MDVDEICRCCTSESKDMVDIYSSIECQNTEEVVRTMLTWSLNIEIFPDDGLPNMICLQCLEALKSAYCFKKSVENSKIILLDRLENKKNEAFDLSDDEPLAETLKNERCDNNGLPLSDASEISPEFEDDHIEPTNKTDLSRHETGFEKYYCTLCSSKFANATQMYVHYTTSHESMQSGRPCDFCNQRFSDFKSLIEHRKRHFHPYLCLVCWEGFFEEGHYKYHASTCKPVSKDESYTDNGRKMTVCHVCGKPYPTTYIKVHTRIHNEGSLSCRYCGKKFKQHSSLGSHVIWNHKKEKKHKCHYCDRLFMTSSARGTHIRESHMKEKNIACETCGKLFFSNSRMKKHNLTHTGEKNFSCNVCSKSYQTRYGLNVHLKSHSSWKT